MLQEKEIGKIYKQKQKFYQRKHNEDSRDSEVTSEPVMEEKMEKIRNVNTVEEYTSQRCVEPMVKNAENVRRRTIGQAAVKVKLLMKRNCV